MHNIKHWIGREHQERHRRQRVVQQKFADNNIGREEWNNNIEQNVDNRRALRGVINNIDNKEIEDNDHFDNNSE